MAKKYYWLKLQTDFFKRHDIRIIEEMPNGKDYILFYMKLLVESISHEGNLRFSETIPYNDNMLSTITNTNIDIVRSAIKIFSELKLMDILDDGTFYLGEVNKMIGNETEWAEKKRIYREAQKLLPKPNENKRTKKDIVRQELDIEIELDIDIDKDKSIIKKPPKKKYGEFKNVLLTDEELLKLQERFRDVQDRIERLSLYIMSKGAKYSSHYATILSWARKDPAIVKPKEMEMTFE